MLDSPLGSGKGPLSPLPLSKQLYHSLSSLYHCLSQQLATAHVYTMHILSILIHSLMISLTFHQHKHQYFHLYSVVGKYHRYGSAYHVYRLTDCLFTRKLEEQY